MVGVIDGCMRTSEVLRFVSGKEGGGMMCFRVVLGVVGGVVMVITVGAV